MTAAKTPTFPTEIWVQNMSERLHVFVDDNEAFAKHQARIEAQRATNEERLRTGMDPLSPGDIDRTLRVKHYAAPGLTRIPIGNARFFADAVDQCRLMSAELEIVEGGPASLSAREATALAKRTASGAARKAWLAVETRKTVRDSLLERDAESKAHRSATDEQVDKLSSASGGEAAS